METSQAINVCLFVFAFGGGIGVLYLAIYWITCAINHKYGLDKQPEVRTVVQEAQPQQPTIIKIESGGMQYPMQGEIQRPQLETSKKEVNELFVEDNPMLKKKNVKDIKIETSFEKGKRIGKRK